MDYSHNKNIQNRKMITTCNHGHFTHDIKGHFTLQWRSPPFMNSRGILKCDWLQASLLYSGGLHYGQESFGGEQCTWMPTRRTFLKRGLLQRSRFLGNLKASYKKLDL